MDPYGERQTTVTNYSVLLNSQQKISSDGPTECWESNIRVWNKKSTLDNLEDVELTVPLVPVSLEEPELWSRFRDIGTEMIITKSGRRMFPSCKVKVRDLSHKTNYVVMMDMVPCDNQKYKWSGCQWEVHDNAEHHASNHLYIHPDSPAPGARWMEYPISFHRLKLTNNKLNPNGLVVLHSMHKYLPRLHIVQTPDSQSSPTGFSQCFPLAEAAFIAVTAYQNSEITKLKIDYNPFAKGFRNDGLSRKRGRPKNVEVSHQIPWKLQQHNETPNPSVGSSLTPASSVSLSISALMRREGSGLSRGQTAWTNLSWNTTAQNREDHGRLWDAPIPLPVATGAQGGVHRAKSGLQTSPSPGHGEPSPPPQQLQYSVRPRSAPHVLPAHGKTYQMHCVRSGPPPTQDLGHTLHLPPQISRAQLPEGALECLKLTPPSDPTNPRPLADVLNRIQARGQEITMGQQNDLHIPQLEQSCLSMERCGFSLCNPATQKYRRTEQALPLNILASQSSLGAVGTQARHIPIGHKATQSPLEYPCMHHLLEYFFLGEQNWK